MQSLEVAVMPAWRPARRLTGERRSAVVLEARVRVGGRTHGRGGRRDGCLGALRDPVGRIHWAGTETTERWEGYVDGAIESACPEG
jgi:hypothetical protein